MSDRLAVMAHGKVEQLGTPRDVYERPGDGFRRRLPRRLEPDACAGASTVGASTSAASTLNAAQGEAQPSRRRPPHHPTGAGADRAALDAGREPRAGDHRALRLPRLDDAGLRRAAGWRSRAGARRELRRRRRVRRRRRRDSPSSRRRAAHPRRRRGGDRVTDVVVVGARPGRDWPRRAISRGGGADVLVLEARDRVGGRVEQVSVDDGRPVQLGGEMIGRAHTAYLGLVDELGLDARPRRTRPSQVPRRTTSSTACYRSEDGFPFATAAERADFERCRAAVRRGSRQPWIRRIRGRIPMQSRLDGVSWAAWLRSVAALPTTVRAVEAGALALAAGSSERTSLLAELRKAAAVGDAGFYSYDLWESLQVAEGSAEVAAAHGCRARRTVFVSEPSSPAISVSSRRMPRRRSTTGEVISAGGGRLRASRERAPRNRDRRRLARPTRLAPRAAPGAGGEGRHRLRPLRSGPTSARTASPRASACSRRRGRSATACSPGSFRPSESCWLTRDGRGASARPRCTRSSSGCTARRPRGPATRSSGMWATDPFTRGYTTHWWPGDVLRVGPLHGTHEPPFYVCGSDQWAAGYMEGAVRTGRAAAAAALGRSEAWAPA